MLNLKKAAYSAIAVASIFASALAPAAYADTFAQISGNGFRSDNQIRIDQQNDLVAVQSNDANFRNAVTHKSNTGGNRASGNTGGDVSIITGDAANRTQISNRANQNSLTIGGCHICGSGGTDVSIVGNGSRSDNRVDVDSNSSTFVSQDNNANFSNQVRSLSNTGANNASGNVGRVVSHNFNRHFERHISSFTGIGNDHGTFFLHNLPFQTFSGFGSNSGGSNRIITGNVFNDLSLKNSANSNFLRL